jgi:preprotein translocase subunit SecY
MNYISEKIKAIFGDSTLRRRLLYTLIGLVIFQFFTSVPIPGIDAIRLQNFFANNQLLGLLNIFSGGGLANLSIVMLGVSPYITASIIMQLLTLMFPKLKALYQEEGEAGRKKFSQYSRLLTLPLAIIQAFAFLVLLERQGILPELSLIGLLINVVVVVAGSFLLLWVGELITEFGIGNGVSLIIFAGIISSLPQALRTLALNYNPSDLPLYTLLAVGLVAIIFAVVYVTEAERAVPVTYAKRVRGNKVYGGVSTYLPLRLNQAGVIPIIFALSILLFPQLFFNFLSRISISGSFGSFINNASTSIAGFLANQVVYGVIYFLLVFLFTYFYTSVTFDPQSISKNLQQGGAFIPGVRPGGHTETYLGRIVSRITLVGGLFLGIIAVMPLIVQGFTGITALTIGGTALLIVVSVVLDLIKKIDAQISMKEY